MTEVRLTNTNKPLISLPISNFLQNRTCFGVIAVSPKITHEDAVQLLAKHRIQSLPIFDGKQYTGIVNLHDLMLPAIFSLNEDELKACVDCSKEEACPLLEKKLLFTKPVTEFLGVTEESKTLWTFKPEDPVSDLLHHFSAGVHRVLIETDTFTTFLSQSDVVRFLYAHRQHLEGDMSKFIQQQLKDLFTFKGVITVKENDTILHNFRALGIGDVTGAPVVDESGSITGSLTFSDLKGINRSNLSDLVLTTKEFLVKKKQFMHGAGCHCLPIDTLEGLMKKICETGVHRVWITNEKSQPIGVVSLTDIVQLFFFTNAWSKAA